VQKSAEKSMARCGLGLAKGGLGGVACVNSWGNRRNASTGDSMIGRLRDNPDRTTASMIVAAGRKESPLIDGISMFETRTERSLAGISLRANGEFAARRVFGFNAPKPGRTGEGPGEERSKER